MNFSHWLNLQLNIRNISQTDFAKEAGIHRQTIVKWMIGETIPSTPNISRIAALLAGTEANPWDDIDTMRMHYQQLIINICSEETTLCPCCGGEVAIVSHAE
tara:strand:+ start:315 stop:620 length:306 start_codon:yes stop_codon:yes gene_type:complete